MKKRSWLGLLFGLFALAATAQNPPASGRDSISVGSSTLLPLADSLRRTTALDTVPLSPKQNAQVHKIVPRTASIRSLMLPGLGQAYNRQYWKIPIVYIGFGALGYFIKFNHDKYLFYRLHWRVAYYSQSKTTRLPGFTYDVEASNLERETKRWERYRNLNILGCFLLYGLNIIDANVTAHLKTFDISEDLSLKIEPSMGPAASPFSPPVIAPGVRLALRFN